MDNNARGSSWRPFSRSRLLVNMYDKGADVIYRGKGERGGSPFTMRCNGMGSDSDHLLWFPVEVGWLDIALEL